MSNWALANVILIVGGLVTILAASLFRSAENPHPFYHPIFLGHFGWKKEWWTGPGYVLQRIGTIMTSVGFLSLAIYYLRRI